MDETSASVHNECEEYVVTDEDNKDFLKNVTVKQEPAEEESEGDVGHAVPYGDVIDIKYEPDIKTEECETDNYSGTEIVTDDSLMKKESTEESGGDVGHAVPYGDIDIYEPDLKTECERISRENNLYSVASSSSQCDRKIVVSEHDQNPIDNHVGKNDERRYSCNICMKTFSQTTGLKRHKRIHACEKPFKCDICMKTFIQAWNLKAHTRIHTGEKPYECSICEKTFSHATNLKMHERIHTGEKPLKCNICKKNFTQTSNLNRHKQILHGEKPLECNVCGKAFRDASYLKTHELIHTGEKPFTCNICMRTFRHASSFNRHKRIHDTKK